LDNVAEIETPLTLLYVREGCIETSLLHTVLDLLPMSSCNLESLAIAVSSYQFIVRPLFLTSPGDSRANITPDSSDQTSQEPPQAGLAPTTQTCQYTSRVLCKDFPSLSRTYE
jgi:hypothetical protein